MFVKCLLCDGRLGESTIVSCLKGGKVGEKSAFCYLRVVGPTRMSRMVGGWIGSTRVSCVKGGRVGIFITYFRCSLFSFYSDNKVHGQLMFFWQLLLLNLRSIYVKSKLTDGCGPENRYCG